MHVYSDPASERHVNRMAHVEAPERFPAALAGVEEVEEAEKIKEYYDEQGILAVVNADQDVPEVTEDIIAALGYPEERTPRA